MSTATRMVVQPVAEEPVRTFSIKREDRIEASIEIVFETILEQMGPLNSKPDGVAMPMKLEAVPGGRWYRDLGDSNGHMWGTCRPSERRSCSRSTGRCSCRFLPPRIFSTGLRGKAAVRGCSSCTWPWG